MALSNEKSLGSFLILFTFRFVTLLPELLFTLLLELLLEPLLPEVGLFTFPVLPWVEFFTFLLT